MRKFTATHPGLVRWLAVVAGAILLLHAVAFATLQILQRTTDGVLAGVRVLGHDVSGLDRSRLDRRVRELADGHAAEPVVASVPGGAVSASRHVVGSRVDVDDTVDAAWARGRRWLWRGLADHVRARLGGTDEVSDLEVEERILSSWARDAAQELSRPPRPPRVGFLVRDPPNDVEVEVTEAREGTAVDPDALTHRLRTAVADPGAVHIDAPADPVSPDIDERDVEAAADRARDAVSARVVLSNPTRGDDLVLSPEDLASVLKVRPDGSEGRLRLDVDPQDLAEHLGDDRIEKLEASPTRARFAVVDGEVRIRGGRPGFEISLEDTAERILEAAGGDPPREGDLPGERIQPRFSRADARELGVEEKVSSFTTEYSCCRPRVRNIHLMADMVDGALIRPGERFELNDHVGPRTRDKGFVAAPAIVSGEFVDVVGGGVSQFATTFFNAAFFSGIELDDFQPHSYYFQRYPMGNEATISWRSIDLAVVNDSPYGILVRTRYTDTSVTVEFWSTDWAEVDVERIGPTNVRQGETRNGFDITVRRLIEYPDGSTEVEEYFHRYQPQD